MFVSAEEREIREALEGKSLSVVYQPIVDLRTGNIAGAEALARFRSEPYRTPDRWFAQAWQVGLGIELELLAIRRALEALPQLPPGAYLSLNVAPQTLLSRELSDLLATAPGERLMVELTEHEVVADYDAMSVAIARLRTRRTRLAIDDAGAGFSSFQHILRLRPDVIKLDRGLTTGVDVNPVRFALASALVTFAGSLGANICAEGIETEAELVALQKLGVVCGQGYFLARPGPLPLPAPPAGLWLHPRGSRPPSAGLHGAEPESPLRSPLRLAELAESRLLDSPADDAYDAFTRLAASLLCAPMAMVSLVDAERQFFKSAFGVPQEHAHVRNLPLSHSLCQHAVSGHSPLIVNDAREHPLVRDNRAVLELGVVAYAGVPLVTSRDQALGTLCVIDAAPRAWTERDIALLGDLAQMVVARIESDTAARKVREERAQADAILDQLSHALMMCDIAGHIVRINAQACALFGIRANDVLGQHVTTIKHPDDIERDFILRDDLLAGRCSESRVLTRFRHGDGSWLDTKLTASVVRDAQGAACFITLALEDGR